VRFVTLAVALAAACGGGSSETGETSEPSGTPAARRVPRITVHTDVRVTRVGSAVRLDVEAISRNAPQEAAFETPDRWTISARQGSRELQRLVNGPVSVERREREQAGQWDTIVRFNLVYQVDEAGPKLALKLEPPGGKAFARAFAVADIDQETPEEGSGVEAAAAVDAEIVAEREAEAKAKAEEEARLKAEEEARLKAERKRKKKKRKKHD
jgi:hypothetical protein